MKQLTGQDIKDILKETGVTTKVDLIQLEKRMDRKMNKNKEELLTAIANVALNSPTLNQFSKLEKRVSNLEPIVN